MQTHVRHPQGSEPLQAHLVGLSWQCPTPRKPVRSKCEASRGTCPAAPAGLYHPQRLLVPTHPPFPSEEKAFSKGVVFEKESNHLSLCIIACSRNISLPGLQRLPNVQILDPACGGGCRSCSPQGAHFQELTEAVDTHVPLLPCTVTSLPPSLSYRRPLCSSSPWLSKAIPSIQEGQGARSVFRSVAQRST